jgi:hypothetical protein
MIKIEERNTINGMFPSEINLKYFLVFLLGFSSCININRSYNNHENGLLRYFIQVDESNFSVNTQYKITKVEDIRINHSEDFNIVSVTTSSTGSEIQFSRKSNKKFQGLKISFYDRNKNLRNIQINFYSEIVNIDQLELGERVLFDRATDIVPPLFIMSSLQIGEFIVCEESTIIYNFELLKDLYFFSIRASLGEYFIGEKICQNTYFNLYIK